MISKEELFEFIEKVKVRKPNNPGQSYAVEDLITNIPQTIDLLYEVVNSNTDETLNRFETDFFHHLESIVHLNSIENLPIAIEGLSQKYESFLKKIAYLKYKEKDPRYFYGDKHTKGINGTSLGKLCEGILDNTEKGNIEGIIPLELPDKLLNYKGLNRYFADFVRIELRNKVHYAQDYPRNEIILFSEIVIVLYLLTIQDNLLFLSNLFIKESKYLLSVSEQFKKWQTRFVHILGVEEDDSIIDNIDLDFIESEFDLSELEESEESDEELDERYNERERGKISELLETKKRLVIVGSPGMGKTTTMQFLTFQLAKSNSKIPVYHELRNFTEELDLIEEISKTLGVNTDEFYELLNSERLVILLDGINEVIRKEARTKLFQQVNYLLKLSDKFLFIASSRKQAYHNDFSIPIFQLQLMTDSQIEEFVQKNYNSSSSTFLELLRKNNRILEWARNPLMLTMLISVAKKTGGKIPNNTGKLLRAFIDGIYKREIKRNPTYNTEVTRILLSHLAFTSREDKLVGFTKSYALKALSEKKEKLGLQDDILSLLNSFIDINVLYENEDQLGFTHELYQEYFAAEELLTVFGLNKEIISKYVVDNNWQEVIILFNGLVDSNEAVSVIAKSDPLVAALAINDTINPDATSVNLVFEEAKEKIHLGDSNDSISSSIKSLISLKKLDEVYSILLNMDIHNKELKKALRKAISECYDLLTSNELVDLLALLWRIFLNSSTKINFLSPFFKNIPVNGINELDVFHRGIANNLIIDFIELYFNKSQDKSSTDNIITVHRTYLIKPLIVIDPVNLPEQIISKKIFSVVKTLIGIGKPELAYPIIKKFKMEKHIDILKTVSKLTRKNSQEKAKLLISLFYDDEFALDQKREKILQVIFRESSDLVFKTGVELAIENGYREKLKNYIDFERYERIKNKQPTPKFSIPDPKLDFQIKTSLQLEDNLHDFVNYCNSNAKIPMKNYIEIFMNKFPGQYSNFFRLISKMTFSGVVVVKYDYGIFINCPRFLLTKTIFAHKSVVSSDYESLMENQEVQFQIIGYNKDRQRINSRTV